MVTELGYKWISHLLEDISVKLTLSSIAILSVGDELLVYLHDTFIFHVRKKAVRILAPLELTPAAITRIPHDADRRIIDLIRMARNAELSHFAGHKKGGLLH
jgi:hypothetical protein